MGKGSKPHRSSKGARKSQRTAPVGHSRAGRPRKDGPRYANGRLKPAGPNEKVVAERRALLGQADAAGAGLKAAENPLDLMLARGWLDRRDHEAGRAFAALHARARLGMGPLRTAKLEREGRSAQRVMGDAGAVNRLRAIWSALEGRAEAVAALIDICVLEAWPGWLTAAARTGEPAIQAALLGGARKRALDEGLKAVNEVLGRPVAEPVGEASDLSRFVEWAARA